MSFFFFFQAEDGIRDLTVTGVQTCALPILSRIFAVTTKILLSQAADGVFEVLDKNGTDGEASFSLPVPGTYTVWARALGTPGGQSKIATCATFVDPITGVSTILCSTDNEVFVRGTGKSSFRNVTSADRKSTRLNSSHSQISYAVFCLEKKHNIRS